MVDDKFVTDMKTKANIFNEFFAEQCTPSKNNSVLPINQKFLTQSMLVSLDFNEDEILKITGALTMHKSHGHDPISIRMIQICDKSLLKFFYFKIQLSYLITQIHGKGLIYLGVKRMINN